MYPFLKRLLDLTSGSLALVILSPLLAVIWLVVRISMGSPVLFRQERAGLGGKPFFVYKFRSMNSAKDAAGQLLPDADRLRPLGQFLRRMSLDELPQLFNVVKGEMSLVGPRPLYIRYISRYSCKTGHYRPRPNQRTEHPLLGSEVCPGCDLCPSGVPSFRSCHYL